MYLSDLPPLEITMFRSGCLLKAISLAAEAQHEGIQGFLWKEVMTIERYFEIFGDPQEQSEEAENLQQKVQKAKESRKEGLFWFGFFFRPKIRRIRE